MKKIRSVMAGLLAAALLACPASAMSFPDVDSGAGYAAAVGRISELGIMVGDSSGDFNPDQIVSRCEMASIVCRMLGVTDGLPKSDVFTDVPAAHWANPHIGKASELGIVSGYGDGRFGPGDPVTREQAVTMVIRAIGQGSSAESHNGYPEGYLRAAEESNLLEGITAAPGQGMSRADVAVLLYNYYLWMPAQPGDGHAHQYFEARLPGSSGRYEWVQTGTKTM